MDHMDNTQNNNIRPLSQEELDKANVVGMAPSNDPAYAVPVDMPTDSKKVDKIVADALCGVPGLLAVRSGISDIFKSNTDITKGIKVQVRPMNRVRVEAKLILEACENTNPVLTNIVAAVNEALYKLAGLQVEKIELEVVETITLDEFEERYGKM